MLNLFIIVAIANPLFSDCMRHWVVLCQKFENLLAKMLYNKNQNTGEIITQEMVPEISEILDEFQMFFFIQSVSVQARDLALVD